MSKMDDQVTSEDEEISAESSSSEESCDDPFEEPCNIFHFLQSEGCEEDLKKCNGHCKKEWLDILGNGQLKKRVLKQGQKDMKPTRGDICTVKIIGCLDGGKVVENCDNLSIRLEDYDVIQVWRISKCYNCVDILFLQYHRTAGIKSNDRTDGTGRNC